MIKRDEAEVGVVGSIGGGEKMLAAAGWRGKSSIGSSSVELPHVTYPLPQMRRNPAGVRPHHRLLAVLEVDP